MANKKTVSKAVGKKSNRKKNKKDSNHKSGRIVGILAIIVMIFIVIIEGMGYSIQDIWDKITGKTPLSADGVMSVHYIDVGQGDCILIESDGKTMLIDCGEGHESDVVLNYLANIGVTSLDYVIGTHPHSDHMGGMSSIVDNINVETFIMPDLPDKDVPVTKYFERLLVSLDSKNIELTYTEVGQKIMLGEAEVMFIAPNSESYSNINNYSISIILSHGENKFIFTGDAETLAESEMIDSGYLRDIDVYKVGHHGSNTSSSEDFMDIIKPEYAVIMCGSENSYGHPHDEIMQILNKYMSYENIYRTDIDGSIIAKSDGEKIEFSTEG